VKQEDKVASKKITIERFSVTSAKPFAEVISAITAQIGHPDMTQFYSEVQKAEDDEELQRLVESAVGPTDLMEFMRLDQGVVLRRELGPGAPNVIRLLIGNPLIMRKMMNHVPDAALTRRSRSSLTNEPTPYISPTIAWQA
jgi:hypothetical protein